MPTVLVEQKLQEYFVAGTRLVWYVVPSRQEVHVYTAPDQYEILRVDQDLQGRVALPGFTLSIRRLFAETLDNTDASSEAS